jgi:hypothetical protein
MSQHEIFTEVEGDLLALFVSLQGNEIAMSRDGDTFQNTTTLDLTDTLNLVFHARGIAFAKWKIAITLDDADTPIFKKSGKLTIDNESIVKKTISLPSEEVL